MCTTDPFRMLCLHRIVSQILAHWKQLWLSPPFCSSLIGRELLRLEQPQDEEIRVLIRRAYFLRYPAGEVAVDCSLPSLSPKLVCLQGIGISNDAQMSLATQAMLQSRMAGGRSVRCHAHTGILNLTRSKKPSS